MDKILELAKPPFIVVPATSVAELQAIDESRERDIELVAEHRLLTAVARISNELISSEEYYKPPIETGKNLIVRDENCTDETMTQIAILGTLGIEAFARFNGQHASTIVPSNDKGFWLLNGNLNMHIKHSGKLEPYVSSEMIEATEQAVEELQASHQNAYVYQDARDDTWKVHAFSGEQIRDNSPLYNQPAGDLKIHNGFLLTTEVNAFRILTAIDLLKTLGDNRVRPELDILYAIAKTTLKHLVPKLR